MKTKILQCAMVLAMLLSLQTIAFAAQTEDIAVSLEVPSLGRSMSITITKIDGKGTEDPADDVWLGQESSLDFGTLYHDAANHVFRGQYYFAIDVGVQDNSEENWSIGVLTRIQMHNMPDSIGRVGGPPTSLEPPVDFFVENCSYLKFVKVTNTATKDVESDVSSWDKAGFSGGWLRIYYSIKDIPDTYGAGTHTSTIRITLSP